VLPESPSSGNPRNLAGFVTGQDTARRIDDERQSCPAAHAGFGSIRKIIGQHEEDGRARRILRRRVLDGAAGRHQLLPCRHERSSVAERPAVVLRIRRIGIALAHRAQDGLDGSLLRDESKNLRAAAANADRALG